MISLQKVKHCEPSGAAQLIHKFVNGWDRKVVFNLDCVECSIVLTETPCVIMLLNKQYRGRKWTCAGTNNPVFEHRVNLCFNLLFLEVGVAVWPDIHWIGLGKNMDMMIRGKSLAE